MAHETRDKSPLVYTADPNLMSVLREIEEIIRANERPSILVRWESGRRILSFFEDGKRHLPNGMLDAIAKGLGVVRSEVGARVKFAKKFPEAELSTLVERYPSWTATLL